MAKRKKAPTRRSTSPARRRTKRYETVEEVSKAANRDVSTIRLWGRDGTIGRNTSNKPHTFDLDAAVKEAKKRGLKSRRKRDPRRKRLSVVERERLLNENAELEAEDIANILDVGVNIVTKWCKDDDCEVTGDKVCPTKIRRCNGKIGWKIRTEKVRDIMAALDIPTDLVTVSQAAKKTNLSEGTVEKLRDEDRIHHEVRYRRTGLQLRKTDLVSLSELKSEAQRIRKWNRESRSVDECFADYKVKRTRYVTRRWLIREYAPGAPIDPNKGTAETHRVDAALHQPCPDLAGITKDRRVHSFRKYAKARFGGTKFYHSEHAKIAIERANRFDPKQREPDSTDEEGTWYTTRNFAENVGLNGQRPPTACDVLRRMCARKQLKANRFPASRPVVAADNPDGIWKIHESAIAGFQWPSDPRTAVHAVNGRRVYAVNLAAELLDMTLGAIKQQLYWAKKGRHWRKAGLADWGDAVVTIEGTQYSPLLGLVEKTLLGAAWNLKVQLSDELRERCHLAADHPWLWRPGETGEFPADVQPRAEHYLPGAVLPAELEAKPAAGDGDGEQGTGRQPAVGRRTLPSRASAARDWYFDDLYELKCSNMYRSHAKIRDWWNRLQASARQEICEGNPNQIGAGNSGRGVVISGIKRAKAEKASLAENT